MSIFVPSPNLETSSEQTSQKVLGYKHFLPVSVISRLAMFLFSGN